MHGAGHWVLADKFMSLLRGMASMVEVWENKEHRVDQHVSRPRGAMVRVWGGDKFNCLDARYTSHGTSMG